MCTMSDLIADSATARQSVDSAETAVRFQRASVENLRASLETARYNLEQTRVRAQIAGRVGPALLDVGTRVTGPNDVLTTIDVVDRKKCLRLTDSGRAARSAYVKAVGGIGDASLRAALEPIDVSPAARYERGWRANVKAPDTLPHHPIVLHRGGYPDGA